MKRQRPEEALQITVVHYLHHALDGCATYFHCPNGGKRSPAEAARFKAMGVISGVPDIIVIDSGRCIAIELKAGKGTLTANQKRYHRLLGLARVPVYVCRSLDEVIVALERCGVPLKARLAA